MSSSNIDALNFDRQKINITLDKKSKDKKALSLKSFEEAKKSYEKILANINLDNYKNPLAESAYNLDLIYLSTALLGDTNFELYFL